MVDGIFSWTACDVFPVKTFRELNELLGVALLMVSLLQDDAIYICANLGCLKPKLYKEKVKEILISTLTEVLVHS